MRAKIYDLEAQLQEEKKDSERTKSGVKAITILTKKTKTSPARRK